MRRAAVLVFAAALVAASVWWFPKVRDRLVHYALQRRCMSHAPPKDESVYDDRPGRADALMRDGRYHHLAGPPQAAFLVPPYWRDFYARLSPPGLKSHGTVFLGRMYAPDGKERLVAVDMVVEGNDDVLLMARVVEPGSLLRRPRLVSTMGGRFVSYGLLDRPVPAGRVDTNDPTRLVIFDGRIDARLDERDHVEMRPHDPHRARGRSLTTPPVPSSPASLPTSAAPATRPSAGRSGR